MSKKHDKITSVFNELKDFQLKTVDFAFEQLSTNGRYLVADEVGMGKTKIAKGIIAKAMLQYQESGSRKPYRVFYICSNQALAKQNLKDLNIFNDEKFVDADLNRLIFLARKRTSKRLFSLSSLTPSTSFKITSGTGHQNERKLIYTVIAKSGIGSQIQLNGLKWLLMGNVENWGNWQSRIAWYHNEYKDEIVKGIPDKYIRRLREIPIDNKLSVCLEEVNIHGYKPKNLLELVVGYCELLKNKRSSKIVKNEFKHRSRLLIHLRKILIEVSLENLEADLFILDEFQRFKELVGVGENKNSEASRLANKIFSIKDAKCLMLSATPFKLYSTKLEELENENHYSELTELMTFLYGSDCIMEEFEKLRRSFFKTLQELNIDDKALQTKKQLEEVYKSVMCRTEKMLVSENKNSIINSFDDADLDTQKIDLENFIHTDQLFQTIKSKYNIKISYSIDYNKSVPFPLSFMDGYISKKKLNDLIEDKPLETEQLIKKYNQAWLDLQQVQNYMLSSYPNTKFRKLVDETVVENDMWQLLWLPPSLALYESMGVYKGKTNLSKTLIFSKWVMVPKMIASLLSYEVERRTIGNKRFFENLKYTPQQKGETSFEKESARRKPLPILRLQRKNKQASSMRSFTLLYPSKTLCSLFSLNHNINKNQGYKELRHNALEIIKDKLKELKQYQDESKSIDKNWYWAAPILLDKHYNNEDYSKWVEFAYLHHPIVTRAIGIESENKAAKSHLSEICDVFLDDEFRLGLMPEDLEKVLYDIANGSPANTVLRSFLQYFGWRDNYRKLIDKSLEIAYDFLLFFDKPESIAAVQINESLKDKRLKDNKDVTDIHWNLVLRYCIDGNLQAVIDEYLHMLSAKNDTIDELGDALSRGLNIRTSLVKVEGLKQANSRYFDTKNLRCHYAINYGNQNLESKEGVSRAGDIISNFNSPFRPFVLASTSLGQEGLDFHYYCRRIMHWNLPYNPVELEQREGRINRFKGLVIRQNIASKYKKDLEKYENVWDELFKIAEYQECVLPENPEILPYWFTEPVDNLKIERIVPLLPFSRDVSHYRNLTSLLALYRLTFGQPRQEELLKAIQNKNVPEEVLSEIYKELLINLSPYFFDS